MDQKTAVFVYFKASRKRLSGNELEVENLNYECPEGSLVSIQGKGVGTLSERCTRKSTAERPGRRVCGKTECQSSCFTFIEKSYRDASCVQSNMQSKSSSRTTIMIGGESKTIDALNDLMVPKRVANEWCIYVIGLPFLSNMAPNFCP